MADRALAMPIMLVLNEISNLKADTPSEVNSDTMLEMREALVNRVDWLDIRCRRVTELADYFDDCKRPTLKNFRRALCVFFPRMDQEEAEAFFVASYNIYIKDAYDDSVMKVDETLLDALLMNSEEYSDMAEDVRIMHALAQKELDLLVKVNELRQNKVTRLEFFDEVLKYGVDLRKFIDL